MQDAPRSTELDGKIDGKIDPQKTFSARPTSIAYSKGHVMICHIWFPWFSSVFVKPLYCFPNSLVQLRW